MSGERPWWLPTAVLVAPLVVALVAADVIVNAFSQRDASPLDVGAIAAVVLLHVHLARAEDRWRDRSRPTSLDRWGRNGADGEGSFEDWWWSVRQRWRLYTAGLVALVLGWIVALAGIGPYDITWLAALLTIAALLLVGFEISVYTRFAGRPTGELQLPLFVKRMVWRWPTTVRVISAEWLVLSVAFGIYVATEGTWLLGLVALANALNALSAVLELRNPHSNWRNYGHEPTGSAWA